MGYRVHCNWCGEVLHEDYAKLCVTIHRQADGTKLGREWAKEVRPTLFFCVAPSDADGYNRMGLKEPDREDAGSCYARFMAMIEGDEIEQPDMGMEWRLMPVDKPQEPSATLPNRRTGLDLERDRWKRISRAERDRLAIRFLSVEPLTVHELTERFGAELPDCAVYQGAVQTIVKRLLAAGQLGRHREHWDGARFRYRYFATGTQLNATSRLDPGATRSPRDPPSEVPARAASCRDHDGRAGQRYVGRRAPSDPRRGMENSRGTARRAR